MSNILLVDGHDPEVVRENVRRLSEAMPHSNACGVALNRARGWWDWQNPGVERPPHLRARSEANLALGSYAVEVAGGEDETDYDAPLARARSAEAAHRASRRADVIGAPVEVVSEDGGGGEANAAGKLRVRAWLSGRTALFNPVDRLGNRFRDYTDAARPARFDPGIRAQAAPVSQAKAIVEQIRRAGFDVNVSPDLAAAMEAAAEEPGPIPVPTASKGTIEVGPTTTRSGERGAVFRRRGYIADFDLYRSLVKDAVWDGGDGNVAPLAATSAIVKGLSDAGFTVALDPRVADALKAAAGQAIEDAAAGKERAQKLDADLRTRGMSLYGFQLEGVAWLSPRKFAMLFDDQGLGKTVMTLTALPPDASVVVVCPAVVKGVWRNETRKWRPDFRSTVLGTRKQEPFRWAGPGEIVVTNYDNLPDPDEYGPPPEGTVLVADEAHWLKGDGDSARGRRFSAMAKAVRERGGRTWGLSGTPLLNQPEELWNLLSIFGVAEQAFGTKTRFAKLMGGVLIEGRGRIPTHWEWLNPPSPEVAEFLRKVSLRRRKEDVLKDLPEKSYQDVPVDLSVKDKKALEKALKDAGVDVDVVVRAIEEAAEGKRSLPQFTEMARAREILAKAKIEALLKLVEQYEAVDEPVVVFSAHMAPVEALAGRPGWAEISGRIDNDTRTQVVEDFQAGRLKGIAATIKAAGTGITLTRSNTAIFVDQDWTPGNNLQATDRIHRIGQKRGTNVQIMVANHAIDERVTEILERKRRLVSETVDASSRVHVEEEAPVDLDFDKLVADFEAEAAREREREAERARLREDMERMRGEERERRRIEWEAEEARRTVEAATRPPRSPAERHAAQALVTLAQLDPDRAAVKNDVGFDGASGRIGHALAGQVARSGELTEKGWTLAKALARKFHRQVGKSPSDVPDEVAAE